MDNENYELLRIDTIDSCSDFKLIKPSGYLKILNIKIALFGKLPNRFQKFMLKNVFAIEIEKVKV